MRTLVLCTLFSLALAKPNGYYHQEYGYKASSASYRNNELQHSNDDEGYYSKDGDLEGRVRPRVNTHNQHSEYINPKLQHSYAVADRSSSFGQLHAGFNPEMEQAGGYGYMGQPHPVNSNLRQITAQLQEELIRELQRSVYEHYQRASAYGNAITQAQIDADMRALEEEIRRNVTVRLQEALKSHYGNEGIRGGYSYTILNGRLQPTANYHSQELAELTRQMEANLMRELSQQMQTYYHTTVDTEVHTRKNTYRRVNGNYPPGPIQQPPPQMYPPMPRPQPPLPQPYPQPHPQPVHIPVHVPDSITTVATRVQTELNEILNKILEDVDKRYFSTSTYHNLDNYNFDQILAQLQEDLRANITFHLDNEIKRTYGFTNYASKYSVEDVENLRRQIEHNLMTKLNRDFNRQREKFFQTHMPNRPIFQPHPIPANHIYYPVTPLSNFHYPGEIAAIHRQLQESMSRQIQTALMQQSYRQAHMYGSNFNPEAHYQATLQQLSEELNRNLTRQMEHLYNSQQYQQSGTYQAQLANMRNQLQMELQRQLQQGLQQSFSRYSSWSSSASRTASTNYRPVRGFDPNLYRHYGPPGNVAIVGEDCMMGDDPSASQPRKKRSLPKNTDLTQQVETSDEDDFTQQTQGLDNQDLLQQVQTHDDLNQQAQTFDDEDLAQQLQTHDALTQQALRDPHLTQQVQTHDDLTQQAQTFDDQDLTQQLQTHDGLTQQTLDNQQLTQQVQTHDNLGNLEPIIQPQRTWTQGQSLTPQVQTQQQPTQQIQTDGILNQAHGLAQSTSDMDYYKPKPSTSRYHYYTPIYRQRYPTPHTHDSYSQHVPHGTVGQRVQYYENLMAPSRLNRYRPYTPRPYDQQIGQQTDDTNLTQQTQTLNEPQLSNQYPQHTTPDLNNQRRPFSVQKPTQPIQPLGQQVEDTDLTQQTLNEPQLSSQNTPDQTITQPVWPPRPRPKPQIQPLGQQVEDTDLTQQTLNEPQLSSQNTADQTITQPIWPPRPPSRPLIPPRYDSHLTQQPQQLNLPQESNQPQWVSETSPHRPLPSESQLGQQTEDLSLTQQTLNQPNDFDGQSAQNQQNSYRRIPSQNQQLEQQSEDVDLDEIEQDHSSPSSVNWAQSSPNYFGYRRIRPLRTYDSPARPDQQSEDLGQPDRQPYDRNYRQFRPRDRQPQQNYLGQTQQTNEYLNQPGRQPLNQNYRQFGTTDYQNQQYQPQENYLDQTQQTNRDLTQPGRQPYNQNYKPLGSWNQRIPQYPHQVDVFGQTQQTEDDDFKPLNQQTQQVENLGLSQQTEDDDLGKLTQQQSQQVENLGQTQQTEDDDFGKLTQQESQQVGNLGLTQQTEDDDFGKLTQQSQQVENLGLTQQTEDDDFGKLTQQTQEVENLGLTQQTEDDFGKLTQQSQQIDSLGQTQQTEDDDFDQQHFNQQYRQPQSQQVEDINLTQQTEDELLGKFTQQNQPLPQSQQTENVDFSKLTQQDLTQQTEDVDIPVDPETSTDKASQQLTQQVEDFDNQSQLSQQTQDLIKQEINEGQQQVEEEETGTESILHQNQDIDEENQRLIDLLRNKAQHNEDFGPMSYKPRPVYGDIDGDPVQVGTTRQGPPRAYYHYHPQQEPSGRSLINGPSNNVNYAKVDEEENNAETVQEINPVEPQVASEVQQVDSKGSAKSEEPIAPAVPEEVTTTPKPGFWSRLGTSIKNKAIEYKQRIG